MENGFSFADYEFDGNEQSSETISREALSEAELAFIEMRSVMKNVFLKTESLNPFGEIFYRQGKLLEFVDSDYGESYIPEFYTSPLSYYFTAKFKRNFAVFHPCYQDMTDLHLRYYLWWRGEFRNGLFHKTTVSYLKLYAYELVNGIGGLPPKKTLARLVFIWQKMSEIEPHCDYLMMNLIKSFYCVNDVKGLPFELLLSKTPYAKIAEKQTHISDDFSDIYEICTARLPSKTLSGSFSLSRNGYLLKECLPSVFLAAEKALAELGIDLKKLLLGAPSANYAWEPFRNVPYFSEKKPVDKRVDLSSTQWCICENGRWTCFAVIQNSCCFALISYIYRLTESALREQTRFSTKLRTSPKNLLDIASTAAAFAEEYTAAANSEELAAAVSKAVMEYLAASGFSVPETVKKVKKAEEKPSVPPEITFDFSKLSEIRTASDYLCEKLVIAESEPESDEASSSEAEEAEEAFIFENNTGENELAFLISQLSEKQVETLKICLCSDESAKLLSALAKVNHTMPSVLIEEINNLALEIIGDILIDNVENPLIIEDYRGELYELINKRRN